MSIPLFNHLTSQVAATAQRLERQLSKASDSLSDDFAQATSETGSYQTEADDVPATTTTAVSNFLSILNQIGTLPSSPDATSDPTLSFNLEDSAASASTIASDPGSTSSTIVDSPDLAAAVTDLAASLQSLTTALQGSGQGSASHAVRHSGHHHDGSSFASGSSQDDGATTSNASAGTTTPTATISGAAASSTAAPATPAPSTSTATTNSDSTSSLETALQNVMGQGTSSASVASASSALASSTEDTALLSL